MRIHLLIGVVVAFSAGRTLGCGISWEMPTNHFDGVNERGFLSYWEQAGTFDFGNGLNIPLIVNFRSNRDSVSSYGGYGWLVPLLEANVVQLEENRFMLVQPDGWNRYFGRKNSSENTLLGDGGWAAEIKGNTFTAWANCGWKLVYANGKISAMTTPDNRRFDWVRSGDRVTEIREGGVAKLTVKWNDAGTEMAAIEVAGKNFTFARNDKPRVQAIAKQNVVATIDRSLAGITLPDGIVKNYEFGVDENLNPTLKVGDRLFAWNSETKHILSDGDWKYQVTPSPVGGYAALSRRNGKNETEFWHNNRNTGVKILQGIDGIKKIITSFPNGKLFGQVRKEEEVKNGITNTVYQASYDEKGELIGETMRFGEFKRYENIENLKVVTIFVDGTPAFQKQLDSNGDLVSFKSLTKHN